MLRNPLLGAALLALGCGEGEPPSDHQEMPANGSRAPTSGAPWLVDATTEWGLDFVHETGASGELLFPEMAGSGVAIFDADSDTDLDLLFISGAPGDGEGNLPVHRLYLQEEGRFRDATATAGLGGARHGMGVAVADFDRDGQQDVFITSFGPDRLFRGHGDGTFTDVTQQAGIDLDGWSTSAAFCDLDRDGDLDLYVDRYVIYDRAKSCTDSTGRPDYCGPDSYVDEIDALLRNNGDGTFTDITREAGINQATGAGLGVVCEDLDDDGWLDIYVANDGDPNQLWVNQGDGTFLDEALILGAGVNAEGLHEAGMGVLAADFDNDDDFDLFLSHLRDETNTLYRNLGGGRGFEDKSIRSGLAAASVPFTGFGTAAVDIEHDGDLDLVIVNGRVKRGEPLPSQLDPPWDAYAEPNLFFLNEDGAFTEAAPEAAPLVEAVEINRGLAVGDLDGDGDLDLVTTATQGTARIYLNQAPQPGHWLLVDPIDPAYGGRAVGSRVTVTTKGRQQTRTAQSAMSYLSSSDPRAHFGLGDAQSYDAITIRWPDGSHETFPSGEADRALRLIRGEGREP